MNGQAYGSEIDLSIGVTQKGFAAYGAYNYHLSETTKIKTGGYASFSTLDKNEIDVDFNIYQINAQYMSLVTSNRRDGLSLYFGAGALIGWEDISVNKNFVASDALVLNESGFIYGLLISAELDIYLSKQSSFILYANEQWHIQSNLGKFIPYVGVGYRYTL